MPANGDSGFGLGDGAVDELNGAAAMTTLVVLGPLQRGAGCAQMLKRGAHVGLVGPNGLKAHRGEQRDQNQSRSECFHSGTGSKKPQASEVKTSLDDDHDH